MGKIIAILVVAMLSYVPVRAQELARWCCGTEAEERKCKDFASALEGMKNEDRNGVIPKFICIKGKDVFDCMQMIQNNQADLMTLDSGQGYFAGRYHNMMPILAERYDLDEKILPSYYSVGVVKRSSNLNINNLQNKKACISGIGMAAGWMYPVAEMLKKNITQVSECNAVVKSVTDFFSEMCLPGALTSFYNPFGNNPTSVCELCHGIGEEKCSSSDPYAGYDGAWKCLAYDIGQVAFLRHDTVFQMVINRTDQFVDDFELICPDGTTRHPDDYLQCNFGKVSSHIIMTSGLKFKKTVTAYKLFLQQASDWFGPGKPYSDRFELFSSSKWRYTDRYNLMFSDNTKSFFDVGERNSYYTWVDDDFHMKLEELNYCPVPMARWCVISPAEQKKCEDMIMAFKAKDLKPELDCLLGGSTRECMELIVSGDADLMNVDAGDVYLAGRRYGHVPISSEDYGDMTSSFKVVAAARKTDSYMTLFNLKFKRSCLPGIGRGDGWVVPLNIFIETEQFLPKQCTIYKNLGQLFIRSCIPGALDRDYNPQRQPLNLCEGCGSGGFRQCQRNSEELYYGASGAFRCLVEFGGDIAFIRHLTVRDNTDGRNGAIWARNRRSDDYELMCKDGSRRGIDEWRNCHLGVVPANAVITSKYKTPAEREIYWNLLNYGQQFFSSDIDGDFHLFDSGIIYNDLIFTDAAVRLMKINPAKQNYLSYLGPDFVNQIENLHQYSCVQNLDDASSLKSTVVHFYSIAVCILFMFFLY